MTIKLYNTLTRKKEDFEPRTPGKVGMYVCGPTVYDRAHIGNARAVVVFDVLYRLLRHEYGAENVKYVRNITDVDDKIIAAAAARGISIDELTKETTQFFHDDMAALNCLTPDVEPRATAHIQQMIKMIEDLIAKGHAYAAEGHVLFAVESYGEYGALSRRSRDEMIAGARVEVAPYKKNPGDFVLWKPAKENEQSFTSPWGNGRPGWHIECSAMSSEYLSETFDIHGGGADLMFPHHENEIAQSRCANPNSQFARYWVHNGFLTVGGEKMSKSLGNFITVKDLLGTECPHPNPPPQAGEGIIPPPVYGGRQGGGQPESKHKFRGEVIRYALLSTHYRKPLDWNEKLFEDSEKALLYFYRTISGYEKVYNDYTKLPGNRFDEYFEPVKDDLNFSKFFSSMNELCKKINSELDENKKTPDRNILLHCLNWFGFLELDADEVLGLATKVDDAIANAARQLGMPNNYSEALQLNKERIEAKKRKDFAEADRLREQIRELGFVAIDKADGSSELKKI